MAYRADIVAHDSRGRSVLLVEAKRSGKASPMWAAQFRRNLLVHGSLPAHEYFLLALPNRFFLWGPSQAGDPQSLPQCDVDPTPLLAPYFDRAGVRPQHISEFGFEGVLASWLSDVAQGTSDPSSGREWLATSGLEARVRGAKIATEVSV